MDQQETRHGFQPEVASGESLTTMPGAFAKTHLSPEVMEEIREIARAGFREEFAAQGISPIDLAAKKIV